MKFCPRCEKDRPVTEETRTESYTIGTTNVQMSVRVRLCSVCGEEIGSDTRDAHIMEQAKDKAKGENHA